MRLPRTTREALSLIEVWRFTPTQAAKIYGCDQETIGRRVAMAYRNLTSETPRPLPLELVGIKGAPNHGLGDASCAA